MDGDGKSPPEETTEPPPASHQDYGPDYQAHLLEQYKLFVESADRVSARRLDTNRYFLTVNTALFTLLGAASTIGLERLRLGWAGFIAAAGIALCYSWFRLVRSYQGLNRGKFEVIHHLERQLPHPLFTDEWERLGRGEDPKRYLPFTSVECWVPWVFVALYVVLFVWSCLGSVDLAGTAPSPPVAPQ